MAMENKKNICIFFRLLFLHTNAVLFSELCWKATMGFYWILLDSYIMYGLNYSLLHAPSTLNLICQWISSSFHFGIPPGDLQFFLSLTSLNNFVISAYFRTLLITQTSVFIKLTLTTSGFSHAENSVYFLSVPNNIHDNTLHFKIIWCSH